MFSLGLKGAHPAFNLGFLSWGEVLYFLGGSWMVLWGEVVLLWGRGGGGGGGGGFIGLGVGGGGGSFLCTPPPLD